MRAKPEPLAREFTGTDHDTADRDLQRWVTGFYVFMVVLLITACLLFWRYNYGDIGSGTGPSTQSQTITR